MVPLLLTEGLTVAVPPLPAPLRNTPSFSMLPAPEIVEAPRMLTLPSGDVCSDPLLETENGALPIFAELLICIVRLSVCAAELLGISIPPLTNVVPLPPCVDAFQVYRPLIVMSPLPPMGELACVSELLNVAVDVMFSGLTKAGMIKGTSTTSEFMSLPPKILL